MAAIRHQDLILELIELCNEVLGEVRQQLLYYRASVYKTETADLIHQKVEQLRLVTLLFGDELLCEPIRDYDAMVRNALASYVPGECAFSKRVTALVAGIEQQLARIGGVTAQSTQGQALTQSVQKHRRELLAICKHGSRQYQLFQAV